MLRIYPFLLCIACGSTKTTPEPEGGNIVVDADADGYDLSEDCDDNNSAINPSAEELCDSIDNNCNGEIDEGVQDEFCLICVRVVLKCCLRSTICVEFQVCFLNEFVMRDSRGTLYHLWALCAALS